LFAKAIELTDMPLGTIDFHHVSKTILPPGEDQPGRDFIRTVPSYVEFKKFAVPGVDVSRGVRC